MTNSELLIEAYKRGRAWVGTPEYANLCEIAKIFEGLAGSVIGWNEFPQPDTCNQTINGRLDTGYDPSDWRYQANLEAHETGHGVGLPGQADRANQARDGAFEAFWTGGLA